MRRSIFIAIPALFSVLLLAPSAQAYVGPGAGLSLLGALWALVVAVAVAIAFIFAWPFRRMRRRKREIAQREQEARERLQQDRKSPDNVTAAPPPTAVQQPRDSGGTHAP